MPAYSLKTADSTLDLGPFGWTTSKTTRVGLLMSVGSSRVGSEPIDNPEGLQRDALRAAERVALDRLAATGVAQRVEVVKTLADGTSRVDGSAAATWDWRTPGRAIVESHDRGARSVAVAAIVEDEAGGRSYSAPVAVSGELAQRVVSGGEDETTVVAEVAERLGVSTRTLSDLARHGVAIAKAQADLARAGRSPLVAIAR